MLLTSQKWQRFIKTDQEERLVSPNGQFKQSHDSFYVTDSPLGVTNIAECHCFAKTDQS